ncbi:MAG: fumarylacetoacetase [Bacteroidota bacterium]
MASFIPVPNDSDFSFSNLPWGAVRWTDGEIHLATRLGDSVISLRALRTAGFLADYPELDAAEFNAFIDRGPSAWSKVRAELQSLYRTGSSWETHAGRSQCERAADAVPAVMPVRIGDYTDFYASRQHATNVGMMFRDPANALLPNWLHLPVGYHGRASTVAVSGTDVVRPHGQRKGPNDPAPIFGPSVKMDFELEVGIILRGGPTDGSWIPVERAEDHIFGLVLFNDWSARDIQQWEYVPLGPFLAKNFASTMSPWIVSTEALAESRCAGEPQSDPQPLPYLQQDRAASHWDLELDVILATADGSETVISQSNAKHLYWSFAQQIAHHSINGCIIQSGDLMASGTISGNDASALGSMLELTWNGTRPLTLSNGTSRSFLEDGDSIIIRGRTSRGPALGFGECRSTLRPAKPWSK